MMARHHWPSKWAHMGTLAQVGTLSQDGISTTRFAATTSGGIHPKLQQAIKIPTGNELSPGTC